MLFTEESYLRQKAQALSKGLGQRLNDFVNEFPAGQPAELIKTVKLFLSQLELEIKSQSDPTILRFSCVLISELSTVLSWLDNAHTAQSPRGVVQCLNHMSEAIFSKAVSVLVSPCTEYNYSIQDVVPALRNMALRSLSASRQQPLLDRLKDPIYVVRFPRIERDNVLVHAIFGHEFGHPIADDFLTQHEKTAEYQTRFQAAQQKIVTDPKIAAALNQFTNALERQRFLHGFFDDVAKTHKRGVQELLSDAFGAFLYGSSALFAAVDVLIQTAIDDPPRKPQLYPPSRYRWRLVLKLLTDHKHVEALRNLKLPSELEPIRHAVNAVFDYLEVSVAKDSDKQAIAADPVTAAAYEWLEQTLQDALAYAWNRAQAFSYDAAAVSAEVPDLLQRLALNVPPCEVGLWPSSTSVDWRSSLLAGWLAHLARILKPANSPESQFKLLNTTHRLTMKGIELALLSREFSTHLARPTP